ncbi:U6 snRNA phosphodiesterase 1-like [Artemia franciscana]
MWEHFSAQYPNYQIQNIEEPHLSLTRTIFLRHHWIEDFVKGVASTAQHVPRFKLRLANFETYTNEEKTRTFIAAKVEPIDNLILLVKKLDGLLNEYGLQEYYKDPSFHISFAWCLGDHSEGIRSGFKSKFSAEPLLTEVLNVQELVCKCAHKVYKLSLCDR